MWTTIPLVLALSLAPSQGGKLDLINARVTYGLLGPERSDKKFLPIDFLVIAFDIDNITVDDDGKVAYSMAMEIVDSKDKSIYKQEPRKLEAYNSLGGNRVPAVAYVDIRADQPPGDYTVKVTVTDEAAKVSKTLTHKFEVGKKDFGMVQLNTTYDDKGMIAAPPRGVVGQSLWFHFLTVGFERGKNNPKQPDIHVEMVVLDEKGKETLKKPFAGDVNEKSEKVPENVVALPMQFLLALNRPGKFTVKLRATDRIAKKTAEVSFPVEVVESKAEAK
jgi:hypothetical protein